MAFDIPTSPNYHKNFDGVTEAGDLGPCVVCGKGVKDGPRSRFIRYDMETGEALTADEYATRPDVSEEPIGPDCLRRHPELKPYLA